MIPVALFIVYVAAMVHAFVRPAEIGNPPEHDWFWEAINGKETQ